MFSHLRRLADLTQDWQLGISTRGLATTDKPGAVYYASVNYAETRELLRRLKLEPSDTFVDVGAGKGRVLCLAAQYRMQKVIGVEYSPELAAVARRNVDRMRDRQTPVEVCRQAAEDFDYTAATVVYFFNPFDAETLDAVLRKIEIDRTAASVRIAFVMESPAQNAVFQDHGWLECYERFVDTAGHPVALYQSRAT